ncbi:YqaJ viral recombinase family protein, partial [Micromonospora sp. WMMD1102]
MTAVELLPAAEATPDNPRWHELRRAGVTASEVAALVGISPWDSAFSLYHRKANGWEVEDNEDLSNGRRCEPVIAEWWADTHPDAVVCPAGLYASQARPWQLATPDRLVHMACPCCDG